MFVKPQKVTLLIIMPIVSAVIAAATILGTVLLCTNCRSYDFNGTVLEPPTPAPTFAGTNWDGSTFRLSEQKGQVTMIVFGYVSCPNVSPSTLAEIQALHGKLGARAEDVAVVFITVDPERDTPARLAQYIPAFDSHFYGLYLQDSALKRLMADYGVYAEKQAYKTNQTSAGYLINHTASVSVIDRSGNLRLLFPFGMTTDEMLSDIKHLLNKSV